MSVDNAFLSCCLVLIMALITPNDGVNDPNSVAVLDVAIYFCRPNDCRPTTLSVGFIISRRLVCKRLCFQSVRLFLTLVCLYAAYLNGCR